ncbi:MAG: two-component system, chemotaxis family, protein-glutamate methylesterase/glutaminase [Actinomycetota bacterium]|jgi:two-component system chemotaxis response regulator CheB|nr:two-component system, chemotaxis family, protein-glutamate methylesterase/glutaminase [Actinomycetota bacterium]
MAGRDIVVVGASAGGVETLSRLMADLPEDLPASVFVVLHMAPNTGTALPRILARQTKIPVDHPVDGEAIRPNRIYVAVPDRHLVLSGGTVRVTRGPKENGHRPSVDTLFCTAAAEYGARVAGVVLSGTGGDGTVGLRAIHAQGGAAIVQDPDEALFPGMPQRALAGDHPDFVAPVGEIAVVLSKLAHDELYDQGRSTPLPGALAAELRWANPEVEAPAPTDPPFGSPSGFTCPECHGGLWEIDDGGLPRYRCRVGHGFSAESLFATQGSDVEVAMWTAYRALEERAAFCRRLAERARGRHADITAQHFRVEADEVARQAAVLRGLLWSRGREREASEGSGT